MDGGYRVSIVIPTYNRGAQLLATMRSVRESIRCYPGPAEILVIDNNSTDKTGEIVHSFAGRHPDLDIRLVRETRQGSSHARNAGIREARGEIVCFLDDDVVVPPEWLNRLLEGFTLRADVACVAGRIELAWPGGGEPPAWLDERYHSFFSRYEKGDKGGILPEGTDFFTANAAVLRKAAQAVGSFDVWLGRRGKDLLSGEDSEFARKIWRAGHVIAYAPEAYVRHMVPASRATFRWVLRRCLWQGVTGYFRVRRPRALFPLRALPKLLSNLLILPFALLSMRRKAIYLTCFRLANAAGPWYGVYLEMVHGYGRLPAAL